MKKFLLSVAGLSLSIMMFGQVSLNTPKSALAKGDLIDSPQKISNSEKGGGDVFWSTTSDWQDPELILGCHGCGGLVMIPLEAHMEMLFRQAVSRLRRMDLSACLRMNITQGMV